MDQVRPLHLNQRPAQLAAAAPEAKWIPWPGAPDGNLGLLEGQAPDGKSMQEKRLLQPLACIYEERNERPKLSVQDASQESIPSSSSQTCRRTPITGVIGTIQGPADL